MVKVGRDLLSVTEPLPLNLRQSILVEWILLFSLSTCRCSSLIMCDHYLVVIFYIVAERFVVFVFI
jgi:hypothetical protein